MIKFIKKLNRNFKIDWQSKIVDLLIVIVGISIAYKLNTWNESLQSNIEFKNYLESFYEENSTNMSQLNSALEFSKTHQSNIDTLQKILLSGNYKDSRIENLSASLMIITSYSPSTTTMENIIASGEFELIKNIELRKRIIKTYNAYKNTKQLENLMNDYVNQYVTPYFFEHVRFSNFSSLGSEFIEDPKFENVVIGYGVLLNQQLQGYQSNLEKVNELNEKLLAESFIQKSIEVSKSE